MVKSTIHFFLLFFIPASYFCQIDQVLAEWRLDDRLENASIGYCVKDIATTKSIIDSNEHLSLIPASTLKIFTTATALSKLGRAYRYETKIYYVGSFDKLTGVLQGDVIIEGSGDPTLQSEYFTIKGTNITDVWAEAIKQYGITEITGRIIGDASYFDREIPGTWLWEDVCNYYGAIPTGLPFMDNKFTITFKSGEPGSRATVLQNAPRYLTSPIIISSEVTCLGKDDHAFVYGDPFSFEKRIKGTIPANQDKFHISGALPDPALLCSEYLCTSLLRKNIRCKAKSVLSVYDKNNLPTGQKTLLYTNYSPSLDKIVYQTNQNSNNLYCESLLRTLGNGSTSQGMMAVKKYCLRSGADTTELCMRDASGLSRVNTTTPNLMTSVLCKLFSDTAVYNSFDPSLPLSGTGISMMHVGKGTIIENNMRAKTGYMQRVRSYCGYVKTKAGRDLAFSIIFNNYNCPASEARFIIEKFLVALAEL
ncbi:MAG: D-alanyl-D-alanine carboxypeptidase/D-alanyl-D-alanine-endopeptidase [bacterium]|nr:D-alanyl-D-alanine carboxypeptidase/D-alanyl-D-alanine-endopeptidase [bacterium]